ncbi:hypothetical protein GJAV_G00269530 [Gymnothorax javanicus]|nr:hypothetical protein GJAV_G00269530 [Gymnothorax javanicus]
MAPTAPGSRDPSGVQSNSSEQLKGQQPHQEGALTEEGAHEEPCSSCVSFDESVRSQGRDIDNRILEIASRGLDGEQEKQTAALDCSSVSQLQEEMRLPPPEQSPSPETPAVEEEMKTDHGQNVSETSDELSLAPEPRAVLEESLKLLNSDKRWKKMKGLYLINQLAEHQPETLLPDRQDICQAVLREVMNPFDSVSAAALNTLADLLSLLKTYFDPFLYWVAGVLYLKAASDNEILQQLSTVALDHMIESCSPLICMKELLYILSTPSMEGPDQVAVARESFAVHLLVLVESVRYEPEMHELFLSVSQLTQDTSVVVRSCAEQMLAVLSEHVEESTEFRDKSAATPDTIDLRILTRTQEKMTATSTDPINMAPTAPGSRDPSSVQSNSSEQLKGQQPHQEGALTEEGAHKDPCSSYDSLLESCWSQWRDIDNRILEIASRGLDGEQEKQTAALDCSSVSQLQEEMRLPPPEQSPSPETPAVEEEMKTDHDQNLSETSDELSLDPEPRAVLEESLKLLSSDKRWKKMKGLYLINQLAEHQSETLLPDRQDICQAVLREVMNPFESVSAAALNTLADLLSLLKTYFDPFLYWVAGVLYLKAASDNEILQQLSNVALDHMIESCSPLICMKELLYILSTPSMEGPDQEAVARESFAVHLLVLVESVRYEPEMHELFLSVSQLTQDTSEVVRSCAEQMLAVLSEHVEESTEFWDKSAATPDTIDLRILTRTQEKMTATSTDPINMAPTAPGSRDPSGVQSNSSEQLKGQQPHQEGALTEEGAHEDPCSSYDSLLESCWSQWRDIDNRILEIASRGLDGEQEKQTAALDCSSVSQLQEEMRLPPPEQSPYPEAPAVEEEMKTDHDQNLSETSDELSLDPEPRAVLEESLKLLNSDERLMKMNGLHLIYQLAKHQPETLFPDRIKICRAVLREVMNPLDSVSAVALDTLADLLSLLKTYFDPFLYWVAEALFQKAASNNGTLQLLANVALDRMIQSCSPLICMNILLYILSNESMPDPDQEAVARECIAVHLLALVESARYEPEMHVLVLSFSDLTQDTSVVVRSCAEKMLAVLSEHVEESTEFRDKSATTPDTIDLRILTRTQEKMTATSTDPINMAPTAPGSRDPSGVQSNSSEQLKDQQPHQEGALTEEGAHEEPCSSCVSFDESLRSQGRDIDNRILEIASRGLDGEQEKQTAALDCSSVSQLQEEMRLPPPEQSPNPETPAVEEEMKTDHGQNLSETSDELSLDPEPRAVLEESLKLLNSDKRWMKMKGLYSICQLAMHQPETLFPARTDICQAVLDEVMNPFDSVSEAALGTLADLLLLFKTCFDPYLDWVVDVLYLKAASDNETLQRLSNVALDHMIESCSPLICMKEMLFILSNPCMEGPDQQAVARESFAVHLLVLVESVRYEPEMHELFLSVSQLTQDTSEVVRSCAERILAVLLKHVEVR